MLINNTDDRVLVMPKKAGADSKTSSTVRLIPGINEIPTELWTQFKRHSGIKAKLDSGKLIEIKKDVDKKIEAKIEKDETEFAKEIEEVKKLKRKIKAKRLKGEDLTVAKKKVDEFESAHDAILEDIAAEESQYLDPLSNFESLTSDEKEKYIKDCYDVELLNKWKKEDKKADYRSLIIEQIEFIETAPTQERIASPKKPEDLRR